MARPDTQKPDFIDALAPWILTPTVIYVCVPVLFIGAIVMFGLAILHPLAAMLVPLAMGLTLAASYQPQGFPPKVSVLSWIERSLLLSIGVMLAALVPLANSIAADDWASLKLYCDGTCLGEREEEAEGLRWFLMGPGMSLAPLAFLAAVTGSRRVAIAMLGTIGTLAAIACFVIFLFFVLTGAASDVIFNRATDDH